MPQVQVALRRKSKGDMVRSNDVISYIVTGDSSSSTNPAERAYSPQELKADSSLKPGKCIILIDRMHVLL